MSEMRRRLIKFNPYTIVDYILTNGEAYIDTEYYLNPDTEIEMLFRIAKSESKPSTDIGSAFFMAKEETDGKVYTYSINHAAGTTEQLFFWTNLAYSSGGAIKTGIIEFDIDFILKLKYNGEIYCAYVNETVFNINKPSHIYRENTLFIAAGTNPLLPYNRTNMRIYNFKILERGKLIKDFMPAVKGGLYGLAEVMQGKFYNSPNGKSFNYKSI